MTAVVATITVDVDAAMEPVFSEIIPVAVFSGSSAWCVSVETMAVEMAAAAVMIHAGSSSYCSCSAVADVETTAVAADVQWQAEVNSSAFFALYIEVAPVTRPLIGAGGPDPTALFWTFASDSAFFAYTADLFHKKNCHLWRAVRFLKCPYHPAFL